MFRFKILQVCLEHSKEKIDIVGRLRDLENALVTLLTRKTDAERQFFRDEIDRAQPQGELFQKPAEHEEQRLRGLDLVIELKTFLERFRWLNKFQEPRGGAICPFPKPDGVGAEPVSQFLFIQRCELPKGVNPPFVQNSQNFCRGELSLWWVGTWVLELRLCQIRALHRLKFTAKHYICSREHFTTERSDGGPRIPTPFTCLWEMKTKVQCRVLTDESMLPTTEANRGQNNKGN